MFVQKDQNNGTQNVQNYSEDNKEIPGHLSMENLKRQAKNRMIYDLVGGEPHDSFRYAREGLMRKICISLRPCYFST